MPFQFPIPGMVLPYGRCCSRIAVANWMMAFLAQLTERVHLQSRSIDQQGHRQAGLSLLLIQALLLTMIRDSLGTGWLSKEPISSS